MNVVVISEYHQDESIDADGRGARTSKVRGALLKLARPNPNFKMPRETHASS